MEHYLNLPKFTQSNVFFFSEIAPISLKEFVLKLDAKSQAVHNVKTIYEIDSKLLAELGFLQSYLVNRTGGIEKLESQTLHVIDSTTYVCETLEITRRIPNSDRRILQNLNRLSRKMLASVINTAKTIGSRILLLRWRRSRLPYNFR